MKFATDKYIRSDAIIIGISLLCWLMLFFDLGHAHAEESPGITVCASDEADQAFSLPGWTAIKTLLSGWIVMVIAMMLPKLILPIRFIADRCFRSYRLWCIATFILFYVLVWTGAGIFLIWCAESLLLLFPDSYMPAIAVGMVAVVWQFSPLKQYFLNMGHQHRTPAAFGMRAYRDTAVFGILHGFWCIGSGWALMILPMLLPVGKLPAMMVVAVLMISEHLEYPRSVCWRVTFRLKLVKIMVAEMKILAKGIRVPLFRKKHMARPEGVTVEG